VLSLGLLFSAWPWGLQPVPVGGTCFCLVVLTGWFARRPPSLPRRWLGSDVVVLGSGIFAFCAAYVPVAGLSPANRLAFSAIASDRFRQFALFDTIHRLGGYAFMHQSQARLSVPWPTEVVYPSGMHFLFALFDTFLRSATDPGAQPPEFNRYFIYVLAAYAFLIMAIVWAARWVAGPRVAGWRRFVICSAVATMVMGAPLVNMFIYGLDSDIVGLTFFALGVAVTVRPPRVVQEQVLIACALLIAVAFAYNIYAIILGLGMGAAGIVYHRRLRRHRLFAVVTIVVGCAIACYPTTLSLASGFNAKAQVLATSGWLVPLPGPLVAGLALVIAATMTSATSRRLPVWRAMTAQLLVSAAVIGAFAVYQVSEMGHTSYYLNKVMMVGYVAGVIGLGAVGSFLRPLHARAQRDGRPSRLREARLAVVVAVVAMSLATVFQSGLSNGDPLVWARSGLANWSAGKVTASSGPSLIALTDAGLLGDGVPTLVFTGNTGIDVYDNYYAAAVNRDLGAMNGQFIAIHAAFVTGLRAHVRAGGLELIAARMAIRFREGRLALRLIVTDPVFARKLRAMIAANPDVRATVLVLHSPRG
jgi:hypothetical protein